MNDQTKPDEKVEPSIQDILQFDPFSGDNKAGAETGDKSSAQAAPAEKKEGDTEATPQPKESLSSPAVKEAKSPTPQVSVSPSPATKPDQTADLTAAIAQQTAAIREALVQRPHEKPQDQAQQPRFNLGLPPQLISALRSEDEREFTTGISAVVNGIANHVWNAMMEHISQQVLPSVPRIVEGYVSAAEQQRQVAQDFYGTYPTLAAPELRPMVQQIGALIAQERAQKGLPLAWGAELRDEIANRIFAAIPALKQAPQTTQQPSRKQPYASGNSSRPAAPKEGLEAEMGAVLKGVFRPN